MFVPKIPVTMVGPVLKKDLTDSAVIVRQIGGVIFARCITMLHVRLHPVSVMEHAVTLPLAMNVPALHCGILIPNMEATVKF
jgi:hypothetical protein